MMPEKIHLSKVEVSQVIFDNGRLVKMQCLKRQPSKLTFPEGNLRKSRLKKEQWRKCIDSDEVEIDFQTSQTEM